MYHAIALLPLFASSLLSAATTQPATTPLTVVDASGHPAADVAVVVVPAPPKVVTYFVFDGNLKPALTFPYRLQRTDTAGRCSVQLMDGSGSSIAFGNAGWARLRTTALAKDGLVKLKPWARVTGRLMVGSKPAPGQLIMVQNEIEPGDLMADRALFDRSTTTDADGSFVIEHVPPEAVRVVQMVQPDGTPANVHGGGTWAATKTAKLTPGQTLDVTLGGTGRPVEGSIVLPPGASADGLLRVGTLAYRAKMPKLPMPPDVANGTAEQRDAWKAEFRKTDAYKAYDAATKAAMRETRFVPVSWISPTTFRIDDVPAGDYEIEVTLSTPDRKVVFTSSSTKFTIPKMESGRSDEVLTVSPVGLHRPAAKAVVGQPAADFTVPSLDGKSLKLSDYRGKVVLLDFWATWCPPCVAGMPMLRQTYDTFKDTGRFAILSVSYDETAAVAKAYVVAQRLNWDHAWCGNPIPATMSEAYPGGLPTLVLIGANGKVLATDLHDDQVMAAVTAALRAP